MRLSKKRRKQLKRKTGAGQDGVQQVQSHEHQHEYGYNEDEYDDLQQFEDEFEDVGEPYVGMTISFDQNSRSESPEELSTRRGGASQVLPVAESFDPKAGDPADGLEYLYMVRQESSNIPGVSRAAFIKPTHAASVPHEQTDFPPANSPSSSSRPFSPSKEWQATFILKFKRIHEKITTLPIPPSLNSAPDYVPHKNDEPGWRQYIFGRPPKAGISTKTIGGSANSSSSSMEVSEESDDEDVGSQGSIDENLQDEHVEYEELEDDGTTAFSTATKTTSNQASGTQHSIHTKSSPLSFRTRSLLPFHKLLNSNTPHPPSSSYYRFGNATNNTARSVSDNSSHFSNQVFENCNRPTAALIRHLDQSTILSVLSFHTTWLQENVDSIRSSKSFHSNPKNLITTHESAWILSLLSSLSELLISSHISTLRTLAKVCLEILSFLSQRAAEEVSNHQESLNIEEQEGSCWMIVIAIASVWRQGDLLEL